MTIVPKPHGYEYIITEVNTYGNGDQRAVSHKRLNEWAQQVQYSTHGLVDKCQEHDDRLHKLEARYERLEIWTKGAANFMEYIATHYPHVLAEYNMVEDVKARVSNADTYTIKAKP